MSACCLACGVSPCEWCACLCVWCVCVTRGCVFVVCLCMRNLCCVCVCVYDVCVVKVVCAACFIYCKQEQKIQPSNRLILGNSIININRDLCLGIMFTSALGPT